MKLCDLDQRVIVPVVDETRGGMRYEVEMSVGELLGKALEDFEPAVVDAVPVVHGRWVKMMGMMPPEYHGHYECSECKWHMKGLRNSWTREEELYYCPHCGALMDGDGEAKRNG